MRLSQCNYCDILLLQGLIPNPEEERNLEELNRPLLASSNCTDVPPIKGM